jgi:hypothetical protein
MGIRNHISEFKNEFINSLKKTFETTEQSSKRRIKTLVSNLNDKSKILEYSEQEALKAESYLNSFEYYNLDLNKIYHLRKNLTHDKFKIELVEYLNEIIRITALNVLPFYYLNNPTRLNYRIPREHVYNIFTSNLENNLDYYLFQIDYLNLRDEIINNITADENIEVEGENLCLISLFIKRDNFHTLLSTLINKGVLKEDGKFKHDNKDCIKKRFIVLFGYLIQNNIMIIPKDEITLITMIKNEFNFKSNDAAFYAIFSEFSIFNRNEEFNITNLKRQTLKQYNSFNFLKEVLRSID